MLKSADFLDFYSKCLYIFLQGVSQHWTLHWTEEGVKMENQKEPRLIRPSRTPKTNPKNNVFAYYGCQHMVFVCDFLCVFAKFVQKISNF